MGNYNIVEGIRIIKQSESQKENKILLKENQQGKEKNLKKRSSGVVETVYQELEEGKNDLFI